MSYIMQSLVYYNIIESMYSNSLSSYQIQVYISLYYLSYNILYPKNYALFLNIMNWIQSQDYAIGASIVESSNTTYVDFIDCLSIYYHYA